MIQKVEKALRDLMSMLQIAKLYDTAHPEFFKFLDITYDSLQSVLKDVDEVTIGIVGDELAFEKEILFDLSKMLKTMILFLKAKGIERIVFTRRFQKEELKKLTDFLIMPKEEAKKEIQDYLDSVGVKNISAGKLMSSGSVAKNKNDGIEGVIDYLNLYVNSAKSFSETVENVLDKKDVDHLDLKFSLSNLMDNLHLNHEELLKLTTIKRYDLSTFTHIINVSILAMYFSSKLGFAKTDVLNIGISGLFHDVGKLYVSRAIIKKPDKLTEFEFEKIKNHVILGTEMLLEYSDVLGTLPPVVCFEHHLRYDLKGYPKLPFSYKQHVASLIVSICDVYDALFQRRSYKKNYPSNVVYEIMIKEIGKGFDPGLLEYFFRVMGVWSIGTIVKLNNNRIAVVRQENEENIFSPKVEIISEGADKKETIDLIAAPSLKIESVLDPYSDGKDYLSLI
ncbi:HD domain-containing protein [bacterium]|nr:MAG: HD domain-containing protein [bacterium]